MATAKLPILELVLTNYKNFNARATRDALIAYWRHIESGGKMFWAVAGAMSSAQLGITLAPAIRAGLIHGLSVTGANLEESLFRLVAHDHYKDFPDYRYFTKEDDTKILEDRMRRVTDTSIPEDEAFRAVEKFIVPMWENATKDGTRRFWHEYFYELIQKLPADLHQGKVDECWLLAAAQKNLPIVVPGYEDSTFGNIFASHVKLGDCSASIAKSGIEYMGALYDQYKELSAGKGVGFFQIGGGIAGDFPICVVPSIKYDLEEEAKPWAYFCQISDSTTSYGSYSGATPNEKITWDKLTKDTPMFVIESDATIVVPLLLRALLEAKENPAEANALIAASVAAKNLESARRPAYLPDASSKSPRQRGLVRGRFESELMGKTAEPTLSGWGRVPRPGTEILSEELEPKTIGAALSRGLGRSYGDSSLPADPGDKVVGTRMANRILRFDAEKGILRAEAGFCLAEMNRLFMPLGWFTPVTPGTKFVTLGGMVACDVHGKNHHVDGCFGQHVRSLTVRLANDEIVQCSPTEEAELFWGVVGGMGLLGHILEVEVQLVRIESQWISMDSERMPSLDDFLAGLAKTAPTYPMTMGWIDCLGSGDSMGRGILMAGRWASKEEAKAHAPKDGPKITLPFELPNWLLNPLTARMFNQAYYWQQLRKQVHKVVAPEPFFYPLDAILEWNKGYGSRGFTQYQCVIPRKAGAPAVKEFMQLLTKLGGASPLCVIKDCGPEGKGVLSFPLEGTSIAVDMAVAPETQGIVDKLNEMVIATGGRIYLTKDLFTRPEHFRAMEPRLDRFLALRDKYDPQRKLRSAQSVRLFGDQVANPSATKKKTPRPSSADETGTHTPGSKRSKLAKQKGAEKSA